MSRHDTWMPLYVADYLGDTGHLMGPEHGAYLLLLMHYWRTGPLPDDDALLARIARTEPKAWKGMAGMIRAFFTAQDGQLRHKRIEAERVKAGEITDKRAAAAAARWSKAPSKTDAKPMQMHSKSNANASGLHDECILPLQSHTQEQESSLRSLSAREPTGFLEWWAEYPRKDAKGAARKAYAAALRRTTPAVLLVALRAYSWNPDPRFIPHPSTWLNEGRWESAHETPELAITRPGQPDKLAYLAQYRGTLP